MVVVAHLVAVVVAEREPVAVVDHELVADGDAVVDRTADRGAHQRVAHRADAVQAAARGRAARERQARTDHADRLVHAVDHDPHRHLGAAGPGHRHHAADAGALDVDRRREVAAREHLPTLVFSSITLPASESRGARIARHGPEVGEVAGVGPQERGRVPRPDVEGLAVIGELRLGTPREAAAVEHCERFALVGVEALVGVAAAARLARVARSRRTSARAIAERSRRPTS